ncbi:MAG: hypothetical protein AMS23_03650 [Bacteroides sp. SM1_62]|nr:MAG: hypothetical protein AMS26_01905 [Bacteroides sp. SM23_62]KPL26011.1 MAG: hypothetical protein AMS23_03650 [Bacteroides sp. SM1_62]
MNIVGNIIWIVFGGLIIFLMYVISSVLLCLTIIGIPFGIQTLKLSMLALVPFGKDIVNKPNEPGCLSTIMNIIWILIGGLWISLTHFIFGLLLSISIIGIPFGIQHFKLGMLAFTPFGKEIR